MPEGLGGGGTGKTNANACSSQGKHTFFAHTKTLFIAMLGV